MGRGPYSSLLEEFARCLCKAEKDTVKTYHQWHVECGTDPRTVERYATYDLVELNKTLADMCERKAVPKEVCKPGLMPDPPQNHEANPLKNFFSDIRDGVTLLSDTIKQMDQTFEHIDKKLGMPLAMRRG